MLGTGSEAIVEEGVEIEGMETAREAEAVPEEGEEKGSGSEDGSKGGRRVS